MKKKILMIAMILLFGSLLLAQGVVIAEVDGTDEIELTLTPGIYKIKVEGSIYQSIPSYEDPFWYCYAKLSPFSIKYSSYMTGVYIGNHDVSWNSTTYRIESTGTYVFGGRVVANYGCTLNWSKATLIRLQPLNNM